MELTFIGAHTKAGWFSTLETGPKLDFQGQGQDHGLADSVIYYMSDKLYSISENSPTVQGNVISHGLIKVGI